MEDTRVCVCWEEGDWTSEQTKNQGCEMRMKRWENSDCTGNLELNEDFSYLPQDAHGASLSK